MEPAHAAGEDARPVEVAGPEHGGRLVGAVIEDHGRTHALAAIAVDGGDIGAADAVVREPLVERRHARLAHPAFDQLADAVVDHRGGDAGAESEAVGQVGGDVVFAAGDVDLDRAGLAERDRRPGSSRCTSAPRARKSNSCGPVLMVKLFMFPEGDGPIFVGRKSGQSPAYLSSYFPRFPESNIRPAGATVKTRTVQNLVSVHGGLSALRRQRGQVHVFGRGLLGRRNNV